MKIKSFECLKSINNYEKKNTWNIRCLVVESFVEATQHIILKIDGFLFTHGAFERNVVYERSFEG